MRAEQSCGVTGNALLTGFCSCRSKAVTLLAQAQVHIGAGAPWAASAALLAASG